MKCKSIFAAVLFCLSVRAAPQYKDAVPCIHAQHHYQNNNNELDSAEVAALVQSQSLGRIVNHPGSQHHHNVDIGLDTAASGISSQTQAVTVNTQIAVGDSATLESGATQTFRTGEGYVQGSGNVALLPQLPPLPQPTQQPPLPQPAQQFNHSPQHHFGPSSIGPAGPPPPPFAAHQQNHGYNYQQQSAASSAHNSHHQSFGGFATSGSSFSANAIAPPAPRPNYGPPPPLPPRGPPPSHFNGPAPYRPLGPIIPGPIGNIGAPRPVQQFSGSQHQFGGGNNYQAAGSSYAGSYTHNTHGAQNGFSSSAQHGASHAGGAGFNGGHSHSAHSGSGHSSDLFSGSSSVSSNALNGQLGHVIRETFASAPLDPTVEKHIYVHVPPEELEERDNAHAAQLLPQVPAKKHYKIIFIKAPTVPAPNYAQLAAATQQSEEKTLVYVLVKKPDEPSLEELQQLQQQSVKSSKPEVYFIKYKTRKEGDSGQSGPIYTGSADLSPQIDIRANGDGGGESVAGINTSNSYSSTSSTSSSSSAQSASNVVGIVNNGPQPHDLYGVPLQ